MTIQTTEDAIIARLQAKITGPAVLPFPDKPAEYKLAHPQGAILVHYNGSSFGPTRATDVITQERMAIFNVIVVFRSLRHGGSYNVLDAVRLSLTGYRIAGCGKMRPTREEFISEEAGIWQFGMTFEVPMVNVEAAEEDIRPLLQTLTTVDVYETLEIPTPPAPEEPE